MRNKTLFISGIDTDCGKTYITGLLAKAFIKSGYKTITHKIAQTGCEKYATDILDHRKAMNTDLLAEDIEGLTCPYVFTYPASPHLAAQIDKKIISVKKIIESIDILTSKYQVTLSEGAGGLFVPLTPDYKIIDFVKEQNLPLILVSSSKLGSINHTMLSIDACLNRNINLKAVVYNQFPDHDPLISNDTYNIIKKYIQKNTPNTFLTSSLHLEKGKVDLKNLLGD